MTDTLFGQLQEIRQASVAYHAARDSNAVSNDHIRTLARVHDTIVERLREQPPVDPEEKKVVLAFALGLKADHPDSLVQQNLLNPLIASYTHFVRSAASAG